MPITYNPYLAKAALALAPPTDPSASIDLNPPDGKIWAPGWYHPNGYIDQAVDATGAALAPPAKSKGPKAVPHGLADIISAIGYGGQPDLGPMPDENGAPSAPAAPYTPDPRVKAFLQALGKGDSGSEQIMGQSGLPGEIQAPHLIAPNYSAAEAALAAGKPHPVSAPQYVKPNYAVSDELWDQSKPAGLGDQQLEDDKWGRIISGAASGLLNADHQKLLAGVVGALGGYGSSLQNKTKLSVEQADKTSEYMMRKAGYNERKAGDLAQTENTQSTANYNAETHNQTEKTSYYRALGGLEEGKASGAASTQNRNAELGYQANVRNAEIQAQKKGWKSLGMKGNDIVYQYIDKDGNVVVGTKPLASFHGVNGNVQGKMASGAEGESGLETLIQMSKSTGALRAIIGDRDFATLTKPEQDYGSGAMGDLAAHYGDTGKKAAYERAMADENNLIAAYLTNNPDKLDALVGALQGTK